MRLAALFSGGKDSMYSIFHAQNSGHDVPCLLTIFPKSHNSHLLHYENIALTTLQSKSMKIPLMRKISDSDLPDSEILILKNLLQEAKKRFQIDGLVHGGIASKFQKDTFKKICDELDLSLLSPIWGIDSKIYMNTLITSGFEFMITSVTSEGLDDSWLGKSLSYNDLNTLETLSEKFGFNLNFEGGEAETFVINCPLFESPIKITKFKKFWDGYRGRFEILEAKLDDNVR